jgi:hypothetical protein
LKLALIGKPGEHLYEDKTNGKKGQRVEYYALVLAFTYDYISSRIQEK